MHWKLGDRLTHGHNPGLGPGRVVAIEGRSLIVEFPRQGTRLRLAASAPALRPLELRPGQRVRLAATGAEARLSALLDTGRVRLADGREVLAEDVWPIDTTRDLVERLAAGDLDPVDDFANRFDALHLLALREARGLGSFLGGRIRLFPHQLHAAERATASTPVRWLLADEVGLGKTVEACLILSRLLRRGQADRCLVVAPETLTVQWLGELWRKYHQVFVLLDEARLADVARDHGTDFNPFDVHRRAVIALETLVARPLLTRRAVEAGIDLLVVDEAHHLRRPAAHPGNPAWRALAPIAALGRHVVLLTAIPLDDDVHGFFRLLQLLRPADFPESESFDERLARHEPLPACTSSTRRVDIGGLPPRVGVAIESQDDAAAPAVTSGWARRLELVEATRAAEAPHALSRRQKADRVRRALASGAALLPVLGRGDEKLARLAHRADAEDPRLAWLAAQAPRWRAAGEKTLVFVAHLETLELVREALSRRAQLATGVFHEQLAPARRDIEVAQFRLPEGPSLLVSTECGGEGRNFEFCRRLVLFDLPWSPLVVEQRVGRLDRIGRTHPVETVYFVPPAGIGRDVARLHEAVGVFREPVAGLEPELARVAVSIETAALSPSGTLSGERFAAIVSSALRAQSRIREAAHRELHRDPYNAAMAESILGRVPPELESLNEDVVTTACERLHLHVERHTSGACSIELASAALVDSLPGVPGGSSFLGTFDREQAVADERLDFFAAGHPLVEGILEHLEESASGRVTALRVAIGAEKGLGLLALYKDGPVFEAVAVDPNGTLRPDWARALRRRPLRTRRVPPQLVCQPGWEEAIRRLASSLDPMRQPVAVAALMVGP
jgi:ATP-dependent helicase HepA